MLRLEHQTFPKDVKHVGQQREFRMNVCDEVFFFKFIFIKRRKS